MDTHTHTHTHTHRERLTHTDLCWLSCAWQQYCRHGFHILECSSFLSVIYFYEVLLGRMRVAFDCPSKPNRLVLVERTSSPFRPGDNFNKEDRAAMSMCISLLSRNTVPGPCLNLLSIERVYTGASGAQVCPLVVKIHTTLSRWSRYVLFFSPLQCNLRSLDISL